MEFGFGYGFQLFNILFTLFILLGMGLFIGTFAAMLIRSIGRWNKNNHSPRLTVPVRVVAKRNHVARHRHDSHTHHSTTYYVTFEVESGDRMELQLEGHAFGLLVEGDRGKLTFQGTRYLGFERTGS